MKQRWVAVVLEGMDLTATVGPTRHGQGTTILAIVDGPGLPLAVIGDRGYDSDPLDTLLRERYGVKRIAARSDADGNAGGSSAFCMAP